MTRALRTVPVVLSLLAVATVAADARAQGNDRSAPTGGRSALMGNTGVALGRDGAAPFLNPATIVGIGDQSVAFSVNFFTIAYQHYSDWHAPSGVDASHFGQASLSGTGEVTDTFKALPSTLCLFFTVAGIGDNNDDKTRGWHQGKQKLALCLGSLEAQDVGLPALSFHGTTSVGNTAQVQSLNRSWNRLSIGPTYSIALSDSVSLGASLHGVATSDSFTLQGTTASSAVGGGALQSSLGTGGNGHAVDVVAIVGGTWRKGPFTVGASAQVPALHVYGKYEGTLENQYSTGATNTATLASGTGDFRAPPPIRLAVGAGMESKRLVTEVDLSYDLGQHEALGTTVNLVTSNVFTTGVTNTSMSATYTAGARGIVNAGAGAEYFLSPSFSVVGGVSTNLSSLRSLSPTMTVGNLAPVRTNRINLSIGIGSYGKAGDLLLGTQLSYGWGQALGINPYVVPNQFAVIDTQNYQALIVLAGTTNLRTLGRAVKSVEEVVVEGKPEDAPKVQPALVDTNATPAGLATPAPAPGTTRAPGAAAAPGTTTAPAAAGAPGTAAAPGSPPTPGPALSPGETPHKASPAAGPGATPKGEAAPKGETPKGEAAPKAPATATPATGADAGAPANEPAPAPSGTTAPSDPPANAPDKATPLKPSPLPKK